MKTAYFDCAYGVAGDMILGALLDAGAPFETLRETLERGLGIEGIRLERSRVVRAGVGATRLEVHVDSDHDHHHHHLSGVVGIIGNANLPRVVKERAIACFGRLAEAEAKVHGTTAETVHFHEVGCLDAIADVTGAMLALDLLGVERVVASPLTLGSGTARCAHGVIPVPAPATVEILQGIPTRGGDFDFEMTTPTGAAILATVAEGFGPQPCLIGSDCGYGAGKREIEGHANFLRVLIGETATGSDTVPLPGALHLHRLALLVTEVDDMPPEHLGDLMGRLFDAGCLDAHFTSVQMKKNRPGTQVQVLCEPNRRAEFAEMLLRHTSTFGLKILDIERACVPRREETIDTELGPLDVKIGLWGDDVLKVTPEYESCRRLAEASGRPLAEVYARAQAAILQHTFE